MTDVTRILNAIERGDAKATDELLPLVYEELRLLAAQKLSHEPPGQTLQATALVHEAYLITVRHVDEKSHSAHTTWEILCAQKKQQGMAGMMNVNYLFPSRCLNWKCYHSQSL